MILDPTLTYGSLDLTASPYLWEFGGDLGAPQNASEVLLLPLTDGEVEISERSGNRTLSFTVLVEGASLAALATAEAALEAECRKDRNTLTLNPGDGVAVATVFDTFRAQLTLQRDDDFEQSLVRRYTLTMKALPFGRSASASSANPTGTSIGTARQRMHTVTAGGSATTEAALIVSHASTALGDAMVYTCPDDGRGYSPPLRQYLALSGSTTSDAALVSGARNNLADGWIAEIPDDELYPGRHLMLARVRASAAGSSSMGASAFTRIGPTGASIGGAESITTTLTFGGDYATWRWVVLGVFQMPVATAFDPASAITSVGINDLDGGAGITVDIDEALWLNLSVGAFSQVACGTDTPAPGGATKRLYLDPPTQDRPSGIVLAGNETDKSDAFYPRDDVIAWDEHTLSPGANSVLTVTTNVTSPALAVSWFNKWHSHAGS